MEPFPCLEQVDSTGSGVVAVALGVKQDVSTSYEHPLDQV